MALIKCPECGHMISEYADKCISCGCPMNKIKELTKTVVVQPAGDAISESEFYLYLKPQDKALVEDVYNFIVSQKSSLIQIDHKKAFGFRRKGRKGMVISFKRSYGHLAVNYKTSSKSNTIKLSTKTLEQIKEELTERFFTTRVTAKQKPVVKEKPDNFLSTRKDYEKYLISQFESKIKTIIPDLVIRNNPYMYTFRVSNNGELLTLCWFSNGDKDKLAFKYYSNTSAREGQTTVYPVSKDVDSLVSKISTIYKSLSSEDFSSEEEINEEETVIESFSCEFYQLINKAIKGKVDNKNDLSITANEVASFVLHEIRSKAIEQKYFKNEEEFDKWKYSYRFIPNFYGYTFSLRKLTDADAKVFYDFYKSACVIDKIKEYEKIYNQLIVSDYNILLHDLYDMISSKHIIFSKAKGLTSSFSYVPEETLINVVTKLNEFER